MIFEGTKRAKLTFVKAEGTGWLGATLYGTPSADPTRAC
jgi:hypothetical protein